MTWSGTRCTSSPPRGVADAEKLTAYLAENVARKERRPEQLRVELLARCRAESIEPPTPSWCDRIVAAVLRAAEESLMARISSRLTAESIERLLALVAADTDQDGDAEPGDGVTDAGAVPPVQGIGRYSFTFFRRSALASRMARPRHVAAPGPCLRHRAGASPAWWRLPEDDRDAHRSGVELAYWTNRQVHRCGLCVSCWMRESEPDILFSDGGRCRNFTRLLQLFA